MQEDLLTEIELKPLEKPKYVTIAVYLLIASMVVSTLNYVIGVIYYVPVLKFTSKEAIFLLSVTIILFITYNINIRKNWARIPFLILFGIGLLTIPSSIIKFYKYNPLIALTGAAQVLLQLFAAVLLLLRKSNKWFRSKK